MSKTVTPAGAGPVDGQVRPAFTGNTPATKEEFFADQAAQMPAIWVSHPTDENTSLAVVDARIVGGVLCIRTALHATPSGLAELAFAEMQRKDDQEHAARMAKAPPGACPSCYGEGEQGGQFCGGEFWPCENCGGTGKA